MKNATLKNDELTLYSYVKLKNLVLDIFKLFRYEQFVPVKNSRIETYVLKSLMLESRLENKRRKLLSKITIALRTLNELELKVFDLTFYKDKSEEEISKEISYCIDKVKDFKKSACIKFVSALGLDYMCLK